MNVLDHAATDPQLRIPNLDINLPRRIGLMSVFVLVGVLGAWASLSTISGAIIASGQAVVQGKPKLVQSLDGGQVAEIFARDGDIVAQGDILLKLDATLVQTNLDIARTRLASALALRARLEAEQLGLEVPVFVYPNLPVTDLETASHERAQKKIFEARAAVLTGREAQLGETLLQLENQNNGVTGQIEALIEQLELLDADLADMRKLADQGLARQSQMSELLRSKSQVNGQMAGLEAERARLGNARQEAILETLQATRSFNEEVVTQMRDVTAQIEEQVLEIVTLRAQLNRIDIVAPAGGVVHEMQVTTEGGVVVSGGDIAQIIPSNEDIDFELRVDPRSVDQVHLGQTARLILSSFDPQSTPELAAEVAAVSPDVLNDERSGQPYYRVSLKLAPEALADLTQMDIVPGMPVEAYLETGDRSVLSYLVHPLAAHLRRALRE